ncbi:hypothetical protein T439DRAFT_356251 [Meredithblackwellia eburnea MCA 4105]
MSTTPAPAPAPSSPPSSRHTHTHSHSHSQSQSPQPPRSAAAAAFRASVDTSGLAGGAGAAGRGWASSPRAPLGAGGRPASELLAATTGTGSIPGAFGNGNGNGNADSEAIDRWFEDLQHYEATLEEMATASLDANFKEELGAIEQWFRVLSEAERTAALYSLLQSSTQVQMRFFITVLQQMARSDPVAAGLMSPATVGGPSMESQMEAKLTSLSLKSSVPPASPSRGAYTTNTNRSSYSAQQPETFLSPAAAVEGKKGVHRTSAPANLLLSASAGASLGGGGAGVWSDKERLVERSPSPVGERPRSTGSSEGGKPTQTTTNNGTTATYRPPALSSTPNTNNATTNDFDSQLSPLVGGSWASMVNTPLVPMFGGGAAKDGEYGASPATNGERWGNGPGQGGQGPIVLDDVRKFRRSARVSGGGASSPGGVGGALGGMYDGASPSNRQPLTTMQQNAINLGLNGLPTTPGGTIRSAGSPGALLAHQAQQNWRNGLSSPNSLQSLQQQQAQSSVGQGGGGGGGGVDDQFGGGFIAGGAGAGAGGLGPGGNSPASANVQLANLLALQQQMQLQQLNMAAAAGIALTPVQMMGLQQQQQAAAGLLSPGGARFAGMGMGMGVGGMGMGMGMGGMGMGGMGGMGMAGMMGGGLASPRRSPRANHDRSPGGNPKAVSSTNSGAGSGSNPDEPLDLSLLNDVPAWLRSLRLHKYTTNFESSNWREMVLLDDAGLEAKGVSALGARRKLLKVFETVRAKTGMPAMPGDGALSTNDGASTRSVSPHPSASGDRDP